MLLFGFPYLNCRTVSQPGSTLVYSGDVDTCIDLDAVFLQLMIWNAENRLNLAINDIVDVLFKFDPGPVQVVEYELTK